MKKKTRGGDWGMNRGDGGVDGDRNVKDYTWFGVDKYLFVILWALSCCACFVEPLGVQVCVCLCERERACML